MKFSITCAALLFVAFSANAQQGIRPGLWEFISQGPALPFRFSATGGAYSASSSFTSCMDPTRSVPTDPRLACKVDGMNRSGATISWQTTCSLPEGTYRSEAVAQYSGETMSGTMTTRVPVLGQISQRISGHYLGPCNR
jgi:hypothetical protein